MDEFQLERLDIKNGDIITIKPKESIPSEEALKFAQKIQKWLISNKYKDCLVLFLQQGMTIETLCETKMNEFGWKKSST